MENYLQEKMQAELLKFAAGRQMFCPNCDRVLDYRTTTIVAVSDRDGNTDSRTYCTPCIGREALDKFAEMTFSPKYPIAKVEVDTIDGTKVFEEMLDPADLGEQMGLSL